MRLEPDGILASQLIPSEIMDLRGFTPITTPCAVANTAVGLPQSQPDALLPIEILHQIAYTSCYSTARKLRTSCKCLYTWVREGEIRQDYIDARAAWLWASYHGELKDLKRIYDDRQDMMFAQGLMRMLDVAMRLASVRLASVNKEKDAGDVGLQAGASLYSWDLQLSTFLKDRLLGALEQEAGDIWQIVKGLNLTRHPFHCALITGRIDTVKAFIEVGHVFEGLGYNGEEGPLHIPSGEEDDEDLQEWHAPVKLLFPYVTTFEVLSVWFTKSVERANHQPAYAIMIHSAAIGHPIELTDPGRLLQYALVMDVAEGGNSTISCGWPQSARMYGVAGADVNANDGIALQVAVQSGSYGAVKYLLDAGAIVNINAALYNAASLTNHGIVMLLIRAGADVCETLKRAVETDAAVVVQTMVQVVDQHNMEIENDQRWCGLLNNVNCTGQQYLAGGGGGGACQSKTRIVLPALRLIGQAIESNSPALVQIFMTRFYSDSNLDVVLDPHVLAVLRVAASEQHLGVVQEVLRIHSDQANLAATMLEQGEDVADVYKQIHFMEKEKAVAAQANDAYISGQEDGVHGFGGPSASSYQPHASFVCVLSYYGSYGPPPPFPPPPPPPSS
ncbi:hypothetical protein HDV00_011004 [Rhizophlyctis rosea]|nr:hypothetical protein HDV00_011004 [Rhizophlyctis rosea]